MRCGTRTWRGNRTVSGKYAYVLVAVKVGAKGRAAGSLAVVAVAHAHGDGVTANGVGDCATETRAVEEDLVTLLRLVGAHDAQLLATAGFDCFAETVSFVNTWQAFALVIPDLESSLLRTFCLREKRVVIFLYGSRPGRADRAGPAHSPARGRSPRSTQTHGVLSAVTACSRMFDVAWQWTVLAG